MHHNFSKGISDWVARHNRYSTHEAERIVRSTSDSEECRAADVPHGSPERRQQSLKHLADRLPFRPLMRFVYLYVFRGAFLDGRAGFDYCVLMAFYDYLTRLKVRELRGRLDD